MIEKFPIAVAVDGSAASSAAVRWAAAEAGRRRAPLKVIHVCEVNAAYLWAIPDLPEQLKELCRPTVTAAIELARQTAPEIEITDWTLIGPAGRMLLLASESAGLIVLGRTGRSALAAHLVGSTTYRMAAHAHCPIVVLPAPAAGQDGPLEPSRIVVGIADRPTRGRALDFGLDEAGRHSVELLAVQAWHGMGRPGTDPACQESEQLERMNQLLATHQASRKPPVKATAVVRAGAPASVLSGSCRPHDLLVLGHHRHGPFVPATVGRVIADCIRQAPCPVAVVPEPVLTTEAQEQPRVAEAVGLISY